MAAVDAEVDGTVGVYRENVAIEDATDAADHVEADVLFAFLDAVNGTLGSAELFG